MANYVINSYVFSDGEHSYRFLRKHSGTPVRYKSHHDRRRT